MVTRWSRAEVFDAANGSTAEMTPRRLRTIDIGDPAVGSVSVPEGQWEIDFGHAFIFPSTISLLFGVSVTPTAGNIDCLVIVQDA